jgi:hypothetical protein
VIDEIIVELLYTNNCVIVPKIGAWIGNYSNAKVEAIEQKIYPPGKSIAFNRQLQNNDGVLIHAVQNKHQISYAEAEKIVFEYAENIKNNLQQNKNHILKNIGRLYLDQNNNILFESFQNNFSCENYGLPIVGITPISRLKDAIPEIVAQSRKRSKLIYIIPIFLLLFFVGTIGVLQQNKFKHNYSIASFFPNIKSWFMPKNNTPQKGNEATQQNIVTKDTQNSTEAFASNIDTQTFIAATKIDTTTFTSINESKKAEANNLLSNNKIANAYICVGAFQNRNNANILTKDIEKNGMKAIVIKPRNSVLYRVLILSHTSQIYEDMDSIKYNVNAGAWLYCHHCSF